MIISNLNMMTLLRWCSSKIIVQSQTGGGRSATLVYKLFRSMFIKKAPTTTKRSMCLAAL